MRHAPQCVDRPRVSHQGAPFLLADALRFAYWRAARNASNDRSIRAAPKRRKSYAAPLDYMLSILRGGEEVTAAERMDAAKAAAPYVHARLAHIEKETELTVSFVARLPSPAASVEAWQEERKLRLLKPPH